MFNRELSLPKLGRTLVIEALSLESGKAFGYQEFLLNLLDYISTHRDELKFDAITIACSATGQKLLEKYSGVMNIRAFLLKNRFQKYLLINLLRKNLGLSDNDVVLFTNNYSSLKRQCKHVLVIHDLLYLRRDLLPSLFFRIQRRIFIPRSIQIADKIVAISEWVKVDIENNFPAADANKIFAIYNYFNFGKFDGIAKIDVSLGDYFLVVSSNDHHKNTQTILRAFQEFCKKNLTIRLVIVGAKSAKISSVCADFPAEVMQRIQFLRNVSNESMGALYGSARAFISATRFEGLGMPIIEAMYFNTPAIVSNIEVVKEVTGGHAQYFEPLDWKRLASLMSESESYRKRSDTREFVQVKYSSENTVKKYVSLLNAMI